MRATLRVAICVRTRWVSCTSHTPVENLGRVLVRASNGDLEEMGAVPTPTGECVLQGRV